MIAHLLKLIWKKRGSNSLLTLEILLSFLVLFGVSSFVLYNTSMLDAPVGFETNDKWMIYLDDQIKKDTVKFTGILKNLKRDLNSLDRVNSSAVGEIGLPFMGATWNCSEETDGITRSARVAIVDEDFAEAAGLNILEGRWFNQADHAATYTPMVANQYFIQKHFPGQNMLDSLIEFQGERKIVGIVDDYRYGGKFEQAQSTVFFPFKVQDGPFMPCLLVDLTPDTPVTYEETIGEVIASATGSQNYGMVPLEQRRKQAERRTWVPMVLLLSICAFLCINVALGLFGVLWYNINKRKGEIGLRRALGAHKLDISKQFILEILLLGAIAIFIGIFFAMQFPLLKIIDLDTMIWLKAILFSTFVILGIISLCAIYPSSQAAKIHPAIALHED